MNRQHISPVSDISYPERPNEDGRAVLQWHGQLFDLGPFASEESIHYWLSIVDLDRIGVTPPAKAHELSDFRTFVLANPMVFSPEILSERDESVKELACLLAHNESNADALERQGTEFRQDTEWEKRQSFVLLIATATVIVASTLVRPIC